MSSLQDLASAALQSRCSFANEHPRGKAQTSKHGEAAGAKHPTTSVVCTQVTDRAAAALTLKADGEEVNDLRLFVKGQFADVRAAAKEGPGRGRLSYTTGAGHTLCLSCDQPLAPLKGHAHEPLAPQGECLKRCMFTACMVIAHGITRAVYCRCPC